MSVGICGTGSNGGSLHDILEALGHWFCFLSHCAEILGGGLVLFFSCALSSSARTLDANKLKHVMKNSLSCHFVWCKLLPCELKLWHQQLRGTTETSNQTWPSQQSPIWTLVVDLATSKFLVTHQANKYFKTLEFWLKRSILSLGKRQGTNWTCQTHSLSYHTPTTRRHLSNC